MDRPFTRDIQRQYPERTHRRHTARPAAGGGRRLTGGSDTRPAVTELTTSSIFQQRYFSLASLRILLSDTAADITSLPTVTGTAPIPLGVTEPYMVNAAGHSPFAESAGIGDYRVPAGTPLLGGFIKIEMQTAPNTWVDVTQEIFDLGITGRNLLVNGCADPSDDAVIRLQRVKDDGIEREREWQRERQWQRQREWQREREWQRQREWQRGSGMQRELARANRLLAEDAVRRS